MADAQLKAVSYTARPCGNKRSTQLASRRRSGRSGRRPHLCARSSNESQKRPTEYFGSDGRRKSTIEEAFTPNADTAFVEAETDSRTPPWGISWQTSERSLEWNNDLKQRLLMRITAEKMGITEEALSQRLDELRQLLPNLVSKLAKMGPDNLAKLAADPSTLALKLVQLKDIFPEANTSRMVAHKMSLILQDDLKDIAAAADKLRAMLPNVNVDKLVEDNPEVLNVTAFQKTLNHAKDIMGPDADVIDTLKRQPDMIFQFQQGKDIIPYDEVPAQTL